MQQPNYSGNAPARHNLPETTSDTHQNSTEAPLLPQSSFDDAMDRAVQRRDFHGFGNAYYDLKQEFHRAVITRTLAMTGGNQSAAATLMGISRSTLRTYMDLAGIEKSHAGGEA